MTAASPAIAGAWSGSARSSRGRAPHDDCNGDRKSRPASAAGTARIDWGRASADLDSHGWAIVGGILTSDECRSIAGLYDDDRLFRSHVVMSRHGFGRGEYKYFSYPLPEVVAELRTTLYPELAPLANRWNEAMRVDVRYPDAHAEFISSVPRGGADATDAAPACSTARTITTACTRICTASTSFRSRWRSCSRNRERDFTGGEFVLTEQRPAHAIACRSRSAPPRRRCDLRRPPPPRPGHAGYLPRESPARREPAPLGTTAHTGRDLPRREVARRDC